MTHTRYLEWLCRDLESPVNPEHRHDGYGPDLVIGYATGYGPAAITPFVASLRAFSRASIALVASARPDVQAFLRANAVDRFDAPVEAGWSPHLMVSRFKHYLSILAAYPNARRVLIVDVRDLVFQGDPFADGFGDEAADIVLFAESEPGAFAAQGPNLAWVNTLMGEPMGARMAQAQTICGGTIMGSARGMRRLIRTMLTMCAIQKTVHLEGVGADQAALNVIAHWDMMDVFVSPNFKRAATIGLSTPLRKDGDTLRNPDGSMSPIIHQYDRFPALIAHVDSLWPAQAADPPRAKPAGFQETRKRWRRSLEKRLPEWR